ncbi:MAG: dUTP diphosphatase [Deltaproteobacteria bacterium]|nr:dUTP diphosphatase [Deltaproteobacteria bacterium]MBW2020205.1 dUTP diphosphatase [Deltaproteobacteria bacterium]MBW2075105.1 dUTP diphosphatase [Deltaproteobacteria bacterium]RLB81511.1 MAG: dUTP diphosphatase [Deltaproteobacteria bacterium]
MTSLTIQIRRLYPEHDDIPLPRYMTPQSSGMDLYAAIKDNQVIDVGSITVIPTGIAIALPPGFEAQVRPRSGLAFNHGIGIINAPGTIDADYRGEIRVALINLGERPYTIRRGDRIAQMVIQKVYQAQLKLVDALEETQRNEGGFGHTGA